MRDILMLLRTVEPYCQPLEAQVLVHRRLRQQPDDLIEGIRDSIPCVVRSCGSARVACARVPANGGRDVNTDRPGVIDSHGCAPRWQTLTDKSGWGLHIDKYVHGVVGRAASHADGETSPRCRRRLHQPAPEFGDRHAFRKIVLLTFDGRQSTSVGTTLDVTEGDRHLHRPRTAGTLTAVFDDYRHRRRGRRLGQRGEGAPRGRCHSAHGLARRRPACRI